MSHPRRLVQHPTPGEPESSAEAITADGHDLAMALRAAYLTMHRRANAEFAPFGLTALAEAGGVTQKELARRTASDANTMSEMLGRLEQRGLIARERDADDGRARRVSITASGREVQRRAWDGVATFRGTLAGLVPSDELRNLVGQLRQIAGVMTDPGGNA